MLVKFLLPLFTVTLMLSSGFQLRVSKISHTLYKLDLIARSLLTNFLVVPVIAFLIIQFFELPRPSEIAITLAAITPGAPFAPKLTDVASGDLTYATGLMLLLSVLVVVVTPVLLGVTTIGGDNVSIKVQPIIWNLVLFQLLPLLIGLSVRHQNPPLAIHLLRPSKLVSNVTFALLMFVVLINNFSAFFSVGWLSLMAMVLLTIGALVSGWVLGGSRKSTRKASAVTTGARNLAIMMLIATESFPSSNVEVFVIVFGIVELLIIFIVAAYLRLNNTSINLFL